MSQISKLQYISLCSKVITELENHVGVRDKTLAEFLIEIGKNSTSEKDFIKNLQENDAEFTNQFSISLFNLISKMYPKNESQKAGIGNKEPSNSIGNIIDGKFPGLAIPDNPNMEELNLDIESDVEEQKVKSKSKSPELSRRRHRSRSRSKDRRSKKKHRRKRSSSGSHLRKRSESNEDLEPVIGNVYEGTVTKSYDYGCFVCLKKFRPKKEGLIHISNLKEGRVSSVSDVVSPNQKVFVKVNSIKNGKISLSLKEVDQKTGKFYEEKVQMEEDDGEQEGFGLLTGIPLRTSPPEKIKRPNRISSPEMWELSRIKYFGHVEGIKERGEDVDDVSEDENIDVDLNDDEPAFLMGQTSKSGLPLSPVRVVKNPDGTLQAEALKGLQFARERRDLREQQQRALMENIPKEFTKIWDDPNADPNLRTVAASLKGLGIQALDMPDWKRDTYKNVYKMPGRISQSMREQKESLPIFKYREELIQAIRDNKILIVIGETGSGKTTQMTQYLLEYGLIPKGKRVGCTQPRRVAAMSVAKRVSEEMDVRLGEEVGYSIRFEDCTSSKTIIKYMTDGTLLREALLDTSLSQYSLIMLDEAHERTIYTDVLFGIVKKAVTTRDDFRLIVTSATLDAEKFSSYFYNCKIFRIPGRAYPVEILYTKEPEHDYMEAALTTVMQIHLVEPPGDVLLFLTGQEEIDTACQILYERMSKLGEEAPELVILPVYSALPSEVQSKIFEPAPEGTRKCVIATNIAEASLTIDGIYYVIDPGFAKLKVYNPKLGMDSLVVAPISQASARQRAGRAGRTGPGKCFRLYTESAYKNEMMAVTVPEIQRSNMGSIVLVLKAMGINDLIHFDFMDPPPIQSLVSALETLYNLGALDDDGLLTRLGRKMSEFPLSPQLSKMLLTALDLNCSDEIITIVAMLSVQNIFYRPRDKQSIADQKRAQFNHPEGDHLTYLTVYEDWKKNNFSSSWCHDNFVQPRALRRAQDVRKQLISIMERYKFGIKSCGRNFNKIRKSITAGFFACAAKRDQTEGYRTLADNHQVFIHPSSALFNKNPEWLVYNELVMTTKEYMRDVCAIDPKWLVECAPNFYKVADVNTLSRKKRMEKLDPLHNKYEDPNAWRLSRRKG